MKEINLTCIGCPLGCSLDVVIKDEKNISVSGNTCPRGADYAVKEVLNPTRIVTSTVRVSGSETGAAVCPCKTASDVPKSKILEVIEDIATIVLIAPVHIGDVVKCNVGFSVV